MMAKLGWVDAPFLKRYRKWAFLGAFLVAAILTPTPDPFNQCLMALPMYVFYEVGIISAGVFGKKKRAAVAGTETAAAGAPAAGKGGLAPASAKPAMAAGGEYVGVPSPGRRP
jgi:sec-independent protein translocase protein TatC